MKKNSVIFLILFVLLTGSVVFPQTKAKPANDSAPTAGGKFGNVENITAAQLKNYLEFISSDELEGRDTPSRGLDIAALYIANHLKKLGHQTGRR